MKTFKRLFGIVALVAIIATAMAPQAQAQKRDAKKEAIEEMIYQGNECYLAGDYAQAVKHFEDAQKKGDVRGTHNLAICYAEGKGVGKSLTMAFKLYEKAAKKGYADSQVALGEMYKNGYGCKQDYKKALKWLEKAAKQTENINAASDAMYLIGTCYYYGGYGIKKDVQKAKEWISKSAALGNETAIDNLPKLQ